MPLLTLKQLDITPPGYWRFPRHWPEARDDLPPEQRYITGGDFADLVHKVTEFRIINQRPLGKPEEEIPDWICRNTEAACKPAAPAKLMPGVKASGWMVARFLKAMASWMINGGHVDDAEANRRAEICANCQWNTEIGDGACSGCFGLTARVMQVIGGRKTRFDDSLRFCGICGCSNAVSAYVPIDILSRAHNLNDFPVDCGNGIKCWKKEAAEKTL